MESKFIAFCSVDYNEFMSRNVTAPVTKVFTSYPLETREEIETWIKSQVEKYPDSAVNCFIPGSKYHINTGFVEYNPEASENFELILKILTTRLDASAWKMTWLRQGHFSIWNFLFLFLLNLLFFLSQGVYQVLSFLFEFSLSRQHSNQVPLRFF